ncbi:MAG: hypothetical protein O7J95_18055 [Planctomycetota bacterium]|nr:hypothetical protein [Planctomycetota bacterium]
MAKRLGRLTANALDHIGLGAERTVLVILRHGLQVRDEELR